MHPNRFSSKFRTSPSLIAPVGYTTVLNIANKHAGERLFTWSFHSIDGKAVEASNGMAIEVTGGLRDDMAPDYAFVLVGYDAQRCVTRKLLHWLHRLKGNGVTLGAMDCGQFILAAARLISGPVCVHPEDAAAFMELYPDLDVIEADYCFNPKRIWCSGGLATVSMALDLVQREHGKDLVEKICADLIVAPPAGQTICAGVMKGDRIGAKDLGRRLMGHDSAKGFIEKAGISRRKLERDFKKQLGVSPGAFAREQRMLKVRELVTQTDLPIVSIAVACGISSASTFARAYRKRFNLSATADRERNMGKRLSPYNGSTSSHLSIHLPELGQASASQHPSLLVSHQDSSKRRI